MNLKKDKNNLTKRVYIIFYICVVLTSAIIIGGLVWQYQIEKTSNYTEVKLNIAFVHSNDGYNEVLFNKLSLDKSINVFPIKENDIGQSTLNGFDIVIVSDVDLGQSSLYYLDQYVKSSKDHSLIFLIDEKTTGSDLKQLNIINNDKLPAFEGNNELGYAICRNTANVPELTENVPWNTMPEIHNFSILSSDSFYTKDAKNSAIILQDFSDNSGDVFLFYKDLKMGGNILVFTIWFNAKLNLNEITDSWPYTGYFFYSCFMFLQDKPIPSYRSWPYSPVPHDFGILIIAAIFGALAFGSYFAFIYARKYSLNHPLKEVVALETAEEIEAKRKAKLKIEELKEEEEHEMSLEEIEKIKTIAVDKDKFSFEEIESTLPKYLQGWNAIGLHRQIGGVFTGLLILILAILPFTIFFLWFFPAYIFPSPSGQGMYTFVVNFFAALFTFADLGTSVWMTRKFAAYRISEPVKAINAAQCYLWFQVITGAFQIMLVGFLVGIGFPSTVYAHLTYVFVLYSLFQWLGFYLVFINIFNSLQRTDAAYVGTTILAPLLIIVQLIIVPIFIQIGSANPTIGIALGGAIGSAISNFIANLSIFFISWWLFRKTFGYSGSSIFRVDFDWEMLKDMLKFGIKYAPGQALVPLVMTIQIVLLSVYLDNYNNWLGYWNLANGVALLVAVMTLFSAAIIPSVSEAYENKKFQLLNYNITSSFKWISNFTFWVASAMLAIMVPLILALTPLQFQSVALIMPLLIVFYIFVPYSGLGDSIFAGLNRPIYGGLAWVIEQGSRAILMIILIPTLAINPTIGIFAILYAYLPAIIFKNICMYSIIKKKFLPDLKIFPFKTFIAPGIAGIVFYFISSFIFLITGGGLLGVLIVLVFAFLIGPYVYFFLSGFFGGWSTNGLEEFKRSISIVSVGTKFAKGLYTCCKAGAKFSPWKEKRDIKTYAAARIEAWELTLEKKKISNL